MNWGKVQIKSNKCNIPPQIHKNGISLRAAPFYYNAPAHNLCKFDNDILHGQLNVNPNTQPEEFHRFRE